MRRKSFGLQATLSEPAQKMFFMASTDLDKFRDFVFNSSFLETYDVDEETLAKIKTDDIALMKFSCKYLASSIFGTKDLAIKAEKVKERVEKNKANQGEVEKQAMETYEELRRDHDLLKKKIETQKKVEKKS